MPVDTPHPEHDAAAPTWEEIRDAVAGERAVHAKSTRYLPRLGDQDDDEYRAYKMRAPFYNATRRTLDGLTGVVFRRPPKVDLGSDAEYLRPELERIGRDGIGFDAFAKAVVRETIAMGRVGILTDRIDGGRPYLVRYDAETITNWRTEIRDGRVEPSFVVLRECVPKPTDDPFVVEDETIYRELAIEDGRYVQRVYTKAKSADGKETWTPGLPIGPTARGRPLPAIPFVCVGPEDLTLPVQRSPLEDIVKLNFAHYRAYADLQHGRHHVALPIYYSIASANDASGDAPGKKYSVGPSRVWEVEPGADNRPGIIELTGQGLIFVENAIADMERQMSVLGARLLQAPRKTAAEAAEVVQMRQRGDHSLLAGIVDSVEMGLTRAVKVWVEMHGRSSEGVRVRLNRDFVEIPLTAREISAIERLWKAKLLPRPTVLRMLQDGDVLPVDISAEAVAEELADAENVYEDPRIEAMLEAARANVEAREARDARSRAPEPAEAA